METSFEQLAEVISFDFKKHDAYRAERTKFLTQHDCGSYSYDSRSHKKFIDEWIKKNDLKRSISTEPNFSRISIPEVGETIFPEFYVEINGVNFTVGAGTADLILDELPNGNTLPPGSNRVEDQLTGGLYIIFKHCKFRGAVPDRNCYFKANLGQNTILQFHRCDFEKVDLYLSANKSSKCALDLSNNKFNNRHVTIGSTRRNSLATGEYWSIDGDLAGQVLAAPSVEKHIRNRFASGGKPVIEKLAKRVSDDPQSITLSDLLAVFIEEKKLPKVAPEYVSHHATESICRIHGNTFNTLTFGGLIHFFINGRNKIRRFELGAIPPTVRWGERQFLDQACVFGEFHREQFLRLKRQSDRLNDTRQSNIFQREVLRCERAIARQEPLLISLQDRLILGFSNAVSGFGTTWARPLLLMGMINLVIAWISKAILSQPCGDQIDILWSILGLTENRPNLAAWCNNQPSLLFLFVEMFNPLSSITGLLNSDKAVHAILDVVQKLLYATLAYDIIKTFRRFSKE